MSLPSVLQDGQCAAGFQVYSLSSWCHLFLYNRGLSSQKIFLHCRSFILSSEGDLFSSPLDCIFFSHFIVNASHCTPIMISFLCERFKTSDSVLSVSIFICLITVFPHRGKLLQCLRRQGINKMYLVFFQ